MKTGSNGKGDANVLCAKAISSFVFCFCFCSEFRSFADLVGRYAALGVSKSMQKCKSSLKQRPKKGRNKNVKVMGRVYRQKLRQLGCLELGDSQQGLSLSNSSRSKSTRQVSTPSHVADFLVDDFE